MNNFYSTIPLKGIFHITPTNKNGELHGYCVYYWYGNEEFMSHGNYLNGEEVGLWFEYGVNGELKEYVFHII